MRKLEDQKELYELSKQVLYEEQNRFHRIDVKASRYLTVLTFLVGGYAFFANWAMDNLFPPHSKLEWSLVIIGTLLYVSIVGSWFLIFSVLRIHKLRVIPLKKETFDRFKKHKLVDIYHAAAKDYKSYLEENRSTTDRKSRKLTWGYNLLKLTMILLALFSLLFGTYKWNKETHDTNQTRISNMTKTENGGPEAQDSEQTQQDQPEPDVEPIEPDIVTEGYDPSETHKKEANSSQEDE